MGVIIEPDDLERGMLVSVHHGQRRSVRVRDQDGIYVDEWEAAGDYKGAAMRVRAVSLPYVVARMATGDQRNIVFDTRVMKFCRLSGDFLAALREPPPAKGPQPTSL